MSNVPTNLQILQNLFYYLQDPKEILSLKDASLVIAKKLIIIGQKLKLPTKDVYKVNEKVEKLYENFRNYQKSRYKTQTKFFKTLDEVFDIAVKKKELKVSENLLLPANQTASTPSSVQLSGTNLTIK